MLRVRREQVEALGRAFRNRFLRRHAIGLDAELGDESPGLLVLERQLLAAADRAFGHGISSREEVLRFVECAVRRGVRFDEESIEIRDVLRDRQLTAAEKMDAVEQLLDSRPDAGGRTNG